MNLPVGDSVAGSCALTAGVCGRCRQEDKLNPNIKDQVASLYSRSSQGIARLTLWNRIRDGSPPDCTEHAHTDDSLDSLHGDNGDSVTSRRRECEVAGEPLLSKRQACVLECLEKSVSTCLVGLQLEYKRDSLSQVAIRRLAHPVLRLGRDTIISQKHAWCARFPVCAFQADAVQISFACKGNLRKHGSP